MFQPTECSHITHAGSLFRNAEGLRCFAVGEFFKMAQRQNFTVNVALEPMDMKELMRRPDKSNRRKAKRPDIKINGTAIKNADWIYMPALKVYQARRKSTAAKIYNSVVRQDTVSMRGRGKDFVPLNLPKVDAKFKEFGSECGLGTASKKAEMEPQESPEVRAFELRDHLR